MSHSKVTLPSKWLRMANNILYVIGNGFDLHHGIRSRYSHFKDYLKVADKELHDALVQYFPNDDEWSDFEATLAYLDTDEMIDHASMFLMSYGAENWSDSAHHDYQYELGKLIDLVTSHLKQSFLEWVLQISIPAGAVDNRLELPPGAKYLNFNYTPSLEKIYGIAEKDILYIHHKAVDNTSDLILGHGRNPKGLKSLNSGTNLEDQDVRITEGNSLLDDYFAKNYKQTKKINKENKQFFKSLEDVDEVHVLGHSVSPVDIAYFKELKKNIQSNKVKWKVSYFKNKERDEREEALVGIGIKKDLIHLDKLKNLYSRQLSLF